MKLYVKYNRLNIIATTLIFVVGSCSFFFLLRYILVHQLDDTLKTEQQEITQYSNSHNALPEITPTRHQHTTYEPVASPEPVTFRSVALTYNKDKDWYRQIRFGIAVSGKYYLITVSRRLEETEDLLQVIILVTIGMIAFILIASYTINRFVLSKLWQPFYQTVDHVQKYDLAAQQALAFDKTDIDEFSLLNNSVERMTERVQKDYQSLKEFTGHAAHEMQTPLAIIRTKLDMLMQNEAVLQNSAANITDIENAVSRLSRLNQSLLLLTKVENHQFILNENINLAELIAGKCAELLEMFGAKHLVISQDIKPCTIPFHKHLAEIVISNLLNNAIQYNRDAGSIDVVLHDYVLTISNTSELSMLDKQKVFQKFYRHSDVKEEGSGLGLSIVKQICEQAGYQVRYEYKEGKHVFTVVFKQA